MKNLISLQVSNVCFFHLLIQYQFNSVLLNRSSIDRRGTLARRIKVEDCHIWIPCGKVIHLETEVKKIF